jgi:hypothetical protein
MAPSFPNRLTSCKPPEVALKSLWHHQDQLEQHNI